MSKGFCTSCRFEISSFVGLGKCPNCGTEGIPCDYENQVNISINWHELHLLFVWAEHYGRSINQAGLVFGIAHAVEAQFPERHKLTMSGEVNEMKKKYPGTTITDKDGNEIKT
jgi:hypothetical protein